MGGREKKSTDARHHRNAPTNTCTFESAVATVDAASSAAAVRSSLDIAVERVLCFAPLPPTQPASVHSSRRGSDAGSLDTRSSVSRGSVMDLLANSRPPRLDLRVDLGARCSAVVAAFAVFVRPAVGRRFCWSEREPSSAVGTPQLRSVFSCGLDRTQCGD